MNNIKYETRPVVGYEGLYSISNTGEVFSHNYKRTGQTKQLKPVKDKVGYLRIALCQDGKIKQHLVHRLVLQAFVPNPDNKPCCDHVDTNPSNNHVSNLRWVTIKENQNNPFSKVKMGAVKKGKNNPRYDTTIYKFKNKNTNEVFVGTQYDFINKYNLNNGSVSQLIKGKCKHRKNWILI